MEKERIRRILMLLTAALIKLGESKVDEDVLQDINRFGESFSVPEFQNVKTIVLNIIKLNEMIMDIRQTNEQDYQDILGEFDNMTEAKFLELYREYKKSRETNKS